MIIYPSILIILIIFANLENYQKKNLKFELEIFIFLLIFFVGLRDATGGDYYTYLDIFKNNQNYITNFNFVADMGLIYLTEIIKQFSSNFYFFCLIISFINFLCLRYFLLKINSYNYFSIIILFQPFIIFLYMGYLKQGLALSFILISICFIYTKKFHFFVLFFIISVLFHKSALIFILFVFLFFNLKKISILLIFSFTLIIFLLFIYFYYDEISRLFYFYIGQGNYFTSKGALPRVTSNLFIIFISYIYLISQNYFKQKKDNYFHKFIFIYLIICFIVLMFLVLDYSTVADRLNYYTIPLTLILLNIVLKITKRNVFLLNGISLIYVIQLNIWLIYGSFSKYWEYNFFPNSCLIC